MAANKYDTILDAYSKGERSDSDTRRRLFYVTTLSAQLAIANELARIADRLDDIASGDATINVDIGGK